MGQQGDRERAAQGRGTQLRHPQAAARIRRRRQRPAQGCLHQQRDELMETENIAETIANLRYDVVNAVIKHLYSARQP